MTTTSVVAETNDRLSTLDRYLPVWIGVAMVAGLGGGKLLPDLDESLDTVRRIRDQIRDRVEALLHDLLPAATR